MAMTDRQFKGFLSFVMDALRDAQAEQDPAKMREKLERIMKNLQKMVRN